MNTTCRLFVSAGLGKFRTLGSSQYSGAIGLGTKLGLSFILIVSCVVSVDSTVEAQSPTVGVMGNTLVILGTSDDDDVRVSTRGNGTIRVRADGDNFDFDPALVSSVMFEGFGGDDRFRADVDVVSFANGGSGDDRLLTVSGPAVFDGGAGRDDVIGGPEPDTLSGGSGDDDIFGKNGDDELFGDAGEDLIYGGSGEDFISGGTQDDLIFGQSDDDEIFGDNGEDRIFAGSGDDVVDGGRGPDRIFGSSGDDMLNGSNGADELFGGSGEDVLCGGDGNDELRGNSGDDELFGENGVDLLVGGGGSDIEDEDGPGPCSGVIGGVSNVSTLVAFPRAQTIDANGNGIVDPGDTFELDVVFAAGASGATDVSFGGNFVVIGPGDQVGGVGEFVGDLMPNEVVTTDAGSDACIAVDAAASPGDQIFVEFDVSADGQTSRFRSGPFIVGQITDGQGASAAPAPGA